MDQQISPKPILVDVRIAVSLNIPMIVYVVSDFTDKEIGENCKKIQEEAKSIITASEDSPFFEKNQSDLELSSVKSLSEKEVEYLRDTVGLSVF